MNYALVLFIVATSGMAADVCPLEGTILNFRSEPLADISITAFASRKVVTATSSPEGKFSFPNLPCGNYSVGPIGAFYPHALVKIDTKKQSTVNFITPESYRPVRVPHPSESSGIAIIAYIKGGLADYVGNKPQGTYFEADAHLCQNAVAALRPADTAEFYRKNDAEKLAYCAANFPLLPRWEAVAEDRHRVVARAAPESVAHYEKLATEDDQVQFCLRLFGSSEVVWTETYRAAVRADAMKALGRKPPLSDKDFVQTMSNHWMEMNGIHFNSPSEAKQGMMAEWLLLQVPVPLGMERIHMAAVMAFEAERRAKRERERRAKTVNQLKTLDNIAGSSPDTKMEFQQQFTATLPGDRLGDLQLRQAALWLSASMAVLRSTVWPTPASEAYLSISPVMKMFLDIEGDPVKSATWASWNPKERTEEVAHFVRLIASAAELVLNKPQNPTTTPQDSGQAPTGWVSPELIGRYFPGVADPKSDDSARERLLRAAAVADAAFWILLITSDPIL